MKTKEKKSWSIVWFLIWLGLGGIIALALALVGLDVLWLWMTWVGFSLVWLVLERKKEKEK